MWEQADAFNAEVLRFLLHSEKETSLAGDG